MTGYRSARPSLGHAICPAVFAAGPIFLTAAALASLYLELPRTVEVPPQALLVFLIALIPSAIVGALLCVVPVIVAAATLHLLGSRVIAMRSPLAWGSVGAAAGAFIAYLANNEIESGAIDFALVATAMFCALVAQRRLYRARMLAS